MLVYTVMTEQGFLYSWYATYDSTLITNCAFVCMKHDSSLDARTNSICIEPSLPFIRVTVSETIQGLV